MGRRGVGIDGREFSKLASENILWASLPGDIICIRDRWTVDLIKIKAFFNEDKSIISSTSLTHLPVVLQFCPVYAAVQVQRSVTWSQPVDQGRIHRKPEVVQNDVVGGGAAAVKKLNFVLKLIHNNTEICSLIIMSFVALYLF